MLGIWSCQKSADTIHTSFAALIHLNVATIMGDASPDLRASSMLDSDFSYAQTPQNTKEDRGDPY